MVAKKKATGFPSEELGIFLTFPGRHNKHLDQLLWEARERRPVLSTWLLMLHFLGHATFRASRAAHISLTTVSSASCIPEGYKQSALRVNLLCLSGMRSIPYFLCFPNVLTKKTNVSPACLLTW